MAAGSALTWDLQSQKPSDKIYYRPQPDQPNWAWNPKPEKVAGQALTRDL